MGHFRRLKTASSWRKLAAAMWHPPNDPHIFGYVDLDMTSALALLERYNRQRAVKVTVTHLIARALALILARHPELNAKIGWSHILLRPRVDIFCQVATDGGRDLSGYKLEGVDQLSLSQIALKLSQAARDIREDRDPAFKRTRGLFKALPLWGIRLILWFMSFLCNRLNLHLPKLGMPRDPFGSAMVTSVGMMGIDTGFAPFTPIARCPVIVTVTRIKERPWVVGDRVEPRPILRLCGTFDHRVIDGAQAGVLSGEMEHLLVHPEELLTPEERASDTPGLPATC
jgi:pyruvate/2-oxoglutarate dehydrogenase complex dihydrolipoamide acyltransferase (E2) component